MAEDKYTAAGVNIKEGDSLSSYAGMLCQSTYRNSPYLKIVDLSDGHFRGPRGFQLKNLPKECILTGGADGAGTKVVLEDAAGNYRYAGRGIVAMTGGDITRWGGMPLLILNSLDARTIGKKDERVNIAFHELLMGLKETCDSQKLVLFGGETAELGEFVGSDNPGACARYLWSGFAIGVFHPLKMIRGKTVKPGMSVIALREYGFRNNGLSLVRKALKSRYGERCYQVPEATLAIKAAAAPAVLYDRLLETANGWFSRNFTPRIKTHLISHLSGGAIKSKFGDDLLFKYGFSANLPNLWRPPVIMKDCASWLGLSDRECYEFWSGGQGALVVVEEKDAEAFVELAEKFSIDARVAGEITKEKIPQLTIMSKFSGKEFTFKKGEK
ncbi:hypothetical protein A3I27_01895 [Candidatus Giovannonibacteria bacterium RIFCSPLOWO2_02_FULL_43_11b]|uniref:Phosphoribosylformylglycinamidine cyclo-ligase n=1 Tax=Candidatus Giovannonibacteria bacterium RIFCSPHIGHO2_12_FULL_43_15 TaxID=1798341 RepID=A0A1F5WQX7_9BACT|nr:MAG: hypothetical protein A2739_01895 [Candidatus Giovannonibacteria bacterium RIFCSPHIGHO2_01_FULL_43_100]OGF67827.1 MAG: hypothetical protein A3B97_00925 [Candidatus Giovannonibacteria bacterium RIFCSPHIGHO2_02_FULL_43_32]OGF77987.1 MAG: hypothetical protein A3F23_03280 [Candidatus Giovannonibacteria bacterium RIFCSPHIGHO2_12_FULL_43_15]OGF79508.1 MAG: hypothetical protein A3A15_02145 [Candidatus Giovannonibacteria bacterium RIFCSPLOWO2_01_FULL_43_60]OGF89237.1 MAG: hypothetical protein A3